MMFEHPLLMGIFFLQVWEGSEKIKLLPLGIMGWYFRFVTAGKNPLEKTSGGHKHDSSGGVFLFLRVDLEWAHLSPGGV